MLKYTLLGVLLVAITMVIHAVGTTFWLLYLGRKMRATVGPRRMGSTLTILTATVVILTVLHTIQVLIWAFAYMHLLPETVLHTFEEATYFSFVTFTTLGYGDITFDGVWRVLSGIEALSGVLLIGWSTAMLFVVVQRTWKDILQQHADKQD